MFVQVTELRRPSGSFSSACCLSSSVTSCSSLRENPPAAASCEQSFRRYSAPLTPERMQQELVVKAVRVNKKKKRQQGEWTWTDADR